MAKVQRTLVKSAPELWSELSDPEALERHLEAFGPITITRLEPEHALAWEGEGIGGDVTIEPLGMGTRVTLTVEGPGAPGAPAPASPSEPPEPVAVAEPEAEPEAVAELAPPTPSGRWPFGRAWRRLRRRPPAIVAVTGPAPEPVAAPASEPVIEVPAAAVTEPADDDPAAVLNGVLDTLGAHRQRPFTR